MKKLLFILFIIPIVFSCSEKKKSPVIYIPDGMIAIDTNWYNQTPVNNEITIVIPDTNDNWVAVKLDSVLHK